MVISYFSSILKLQPHFEHFSLLLETCHVFAIRSLCFKAKIFCIMFSLKLFIYSVFSEFVYLENTINILK